MDKKYFQFSEFYSLYFWGNHREALFKEDKNYHVFLELFRKYVSPISDLYAYCLLPTHSYLILRIKDYVDIGCYYFDSQMIWKQIKTFFSSYVHWNNKNSNGTPKIINSKYIGRNLACIESLYSLVPFIHQNPQNHGIVSDYKFWPYSSYHSYFKRDRRSFLARTIFSDDELYNTIMEMHGKMIKLEEWNLYQKEMVS